MASNLLLAKQSLSFSSSSYTADQIRDWNCQQGQAYHSETRKYASGPQMAQVRDRLVSHGAVNNGTGLILHGYS